MDFDLGCPAAIAMNDIRTLAKAVRGHVLRMTHAARASHVGSALSMVDILAVLYARVLNVHPAHPNDIHRDRLIVSKGHAASALYAVLAERGFLSTSLLSGYCADGSPLMGHVSHKVPGVELSTGSLGHGLSVAAGLALAAGRTGASWRSIVILSDGELDEGACWEAALFAAHHRLERLLAIVDYNKIQSFGRVEEVMSLEPLADKWRSFGWSVVSIDGHDHDALYRALTANLDGRPRVVIAHTVKGKGVSFMEDQLAWHYKSPSDDDLARALTEIEAQP